ncbi:MAG: hypothetical protein WB709_06545, partial [Solirubrobacteraceae bacterium]
DETVGVDGRNGIDVPDSGHWRYSNKGTAHGKVTRIGMELRRNSLELGLTKGMNAIPLRRVARHNRRASDGGSEGMAHQSP